MSLRLMPFAPPLRLDAAGVARVGNTRVTLESVLYSFKSGASAEEIALAFPTLQLADVYGVIAFYLNNKDDCEAYLLQAQVEAEQVRARVEASTDSAAIRARLLARRTQSPS
jgi:uncharacterized protein (DUF433 family)